MNEKKAIALCLDHRDPAGFEFLVKKFKGEAFYHALTFTGNPEDAKDICQESFSKAFKAFPALKYLDRFYPWFYMILRNTSLNLLKKKKRKSLNSEKILNGKSSGIASPEKKYIKSEQDAYIWSVLYMLKPEFREVLVLKYVEDRKYDEISALLGIPRGTVMSRLYNARKSFREHYVSKGGK